MYNFFPISRSKKLDLLTCRLKDLEFKSPFKMTCHRGGSVMAIVGHFDIDFSQVPSQVGLKVT